MKAAFICENVGFHYRLGSTRVQALSAVNVTLEAGHLTCLAGPSGSGKSTLLSLLGLIEPVQEGSIRLGDWRLGDLDERQKNEIRRHHLGFVFQQFLLFDVLDASENVAYFLRHQGLSRAERDRAVDAALDTVGLLRHKNKRPLEMSGGQRQRVAIARALVKKPTVLIADEPTASLDQTTGKSLMEIFHRLATTEGKTIVMASHDPMAIGFATRLIKLRDGRLEAPATSYSERAEGPHATV